MAGMTGPFAKLEAQVTALNAQLAKMVALQNGLDPKGYERMSRAAALNSRTFRNAAASTGMFEVQQMRVNKATDDFTSKLQKQKVSFGEMLRQQKLVSAAYKDQIRLQNMVAKTSTMGTTHGKTSVDTATPFIAPQAKGLTKFNQQLAYSNMLLKSGSTQMVNWGKNAQWSGRQLSMGFTLPLVALGAAAGVMAYQVDQALTRVQKVYNTTAQSGMAQQKELDQVRKAGLATAMQAARSYGSAGTDTLNVQAELAAAGRKGLELQKDTLEVMRISRLGELDYNDSIAATISLQSVFNMNSKKLAETFNYINDVENQTSLQTEDFAKAIPIAAAPVKAFGGNIQELGTLLVAMKQNGIQATQGANAIKAAMQRLGRPSAQVQKEWTALTNTDITSIFDKSKNLIDLFTQIGDATKNLAPKDQIKAFAGLFGTYQVTRMMAMVHGMEDLKNGVGQVSVAAKLAGQSTSQWSKVANQEITRYQQSLSGRWDTAINEMKLELSTLGKPFVQVATDIITHISVLIKWFNKLGDGWKKAIAIPIFLTAMAGPLLMLIGLFANLVGNGLKVFTVLLPKMELMTTQQKAASLAAQQNAEAMQVEADSAELLTLWLTKLTAAQALANRETRRYRIEALMNQGMSARGAVTQVRAEDQRIAQTMGNIGMTAPAVEEKTSRIATYAKATAIGFGASAIAMGVMAVNSNKTVDKIAEMVMYGGMLVPMLMPLGAKMADSFKAASVAATGLGGGMNGLKAGAAAFAVEMGIATLAITAAVAVIAAGAFAWYKWHQHQQQVIADQISAQKAITNTATDWADAMGVVEKHYQKISFMQSNIQGAGTQKQAFDKDLDYYSNNTTGKTAVSAFQAQSPDQQTTAALKLYSDLIVKYGLNAKQAQANVSAFLVASGKDFFTATRQAAELGDALGNVGGRIMDWRDSVRVGGQYLLNIANSSDKSKAKVQELADATTSFAQTFSAAFSQSKTPSQAKHLMDELQTTVLNGWGNILKQIQANPLGAKFLETNSITNAKGLEQWAKTHNNTTAGPFKSMIEDQKTFEANLIKETGYSLGLGKNYSWIDDLFGDMLVKSKQLTFKAASASATKMANDVIQGPLGSLLGLPGAQSKGVMQNGALVQQFKAAAKLMPTAQLDAMATSMTKIAAAQGIKQSIVPWKQLSFILNNVKADMKDTGNSAKDAANDVKGVKGALGDLPSAVTIQITAKEAIQVVHDAMSATEDDMVTSAQNQFNSRWDATMASAQASWAKKETGLQNRQQAASDAMDKRFQKAQDNINKAYQKRIDNVNKEIKAEQDADAKRQAMFEAEKKRMQDLADMANKNIDFNTALNTGNFDEAAKIRNDMEAQSGANTMDAIEARRSARVQKAVDRLQKKIDNLEKMRDKELARLQNTEDAQKKHLEKMQQAQSDALKAREDADMASMQKTRDFEEAMLNQRLDLFKTYIAKNQKDLTQWMHKVGLTYDDFGSDIKAKGEGWASYFQKALHDHIIAGASQVTSDDMWSKITPKLAGKLLKGLGFSGLGAFQKFVNTGRLQQEMRGGDNNLDVQHHAQKKTHHKTPHGGGMIGHNQHDNRKGLRGVGGANAPSESWARVQHGEYVVNRKDAYKNRSLLDHINGGGMGGMMKYGTGGAGAVAPISGYIAAVMANGFTAGTEAASLTAMKNYKASVKAAAASSGGPGTKGGYVVGPGGKHRPVPAGIGIAGNGVHDQSTGYAAVDLEAGLNTPAYAVGDGVITRSEAISGSGTPGNGMYAFPYSSYGNVEYLKLDGGPTVLYAHLNKRMVSAGQRVKGGSRIGLTGNTGNSTGPHLHFGDSDGNPMEFLRKGGTVKFDNTPAMLHRGETVLTENLTKKFKDNVASEGNVTYDVDVCIEGNATADDANAIADTVIKKIERRQSRAPSSRRNRGRD